MAPSLNSERARLCAAIRRTAPDAAARAAELRKLKII